MLPGDGNEDVNHRDIVIYLKDGMVRHINELHSMYDPLHYVLIFPYGDKGWHPGIRESDVVFTTAEDNENNDDQEQNDFEQQNRGFITPMKYYSYRLHYRHNSYLHLSCRLFQQYIVDEYAKIEHLRLL